MEGYKPAPMAPRREKQPQPVINQEQQEVSDSSPLAQARESVRDSVRIMESAKVDTATLRESKLTAEKRADIESKEKELASEMQAVLSKIQNPKILKQLEGLSSDIRNQEGSLEKLAELRLIEKAIFGNSKMPTNITGRIEKAGRRVQSLVFNLYSFAGMSALTLPVAAFFAEASYTNDPALLGAGAVGTLVSQILGIYMASHATYWSIDAKKEKINTLTKLGNQEASKLDTVANKQQAV